MSDDLSAGLPGVAGQSVLVAGPPMSGKSTLLGLLLAETAERVIVVSTSDGDGVVRDRFPDVDVLGVVDCVTRSQHVDVTETDLVRYVSSPKNLTEIGMKFTGLVEEFDNDGPPVAVGLDSLSDLLVYREAEDVYRFIRTFTGQASGLGWTSFVTINTEMHDARTTETVLEPFDVVVDTRVADGDRQFRVRGATDETDWQDF